MTEPGTILAKMIPRDRMPRRYRQGTESLGGLTLKGRLRRDKLQEREQGPGLKRPAFFIVDRHMHT